MSTKPSLLQQLWTIFSTKIVKNPKNFVTYFPILFYFLHCHAVSLWRNFHKESYSYFNVIKKSLLCGRFSQKSRSLKCWMKWIAKYGLRFVKSEKNQICHTQIFQNTAYQTCNFFSGNLLSLSLITDIGKYVYWQKY